MTELGTACTQSASKIMLLGAGELGKEFAIAAQRLGIYVIAVDRYDHAPAMQVAHESYVIDMQDANALSQLVQKLQPNYIVPEIEAINTNVLLKLEEDGFRVVPCAKAVHLTMDRKGIRLLAAETLGLKTSQFAFADTYEKYLEAVKAIGLPCVVKPLMSSSGKGQSVLRSEDEIEQAWSYAEKNTRGHAKEVVVEELITFDIEITLLTVKDRQGTSFCDPIGHIQRDGDYRVSWQPEALSLSLLNKAQKIAETITNALGGYGIFGVELFIKGDDVYFNEVSPRPHDTGMVTLISQNLNEFELHLRAILGLPIPEIQTIKPSASYALLLEGHSTSPVYLGLNEALSVTDCDIRLFGKSSIDGKRRMGVVLATADTIDKAKKNARLAASYIKLG